jgi:hypothetical protein
MNYLAFKIYLIRCLSVNGNGDISVLNNYFLFNMIIYMYIYINIYIFVYNIYVYIYIYIYELGCTLSF